MFSAFGTIVSSGFVGESRVTTAAQGATALVREAQIEFSTAASATDAVSMNGMDLVGLPLSVELQSANSSGTSNGSLSSSGIANGAGSSYATSSEGVIPASEASKPAFCTLKLENLVQSVDEVFEEDFQEDIAEEAALYGPLKKLRVTTGATDITKMSREDYLKLKEKDASVAVFLLFQEAAGAQKAHKAMNGRHFAGQTIKATLCDFDS